MTTWEPDRVAASFRDPSGFLFVDEQGAICRQVNQIFRDDYDLLKRSGLYDRLVSEGLLIPHAESAPAPRHGSDAYLILRPEQLEFISYPYEWCFSQLRDAALLTLKLQRLALEFGMILKDASAYNVQFHRGRPLFIDSLSFERYVEGEPWVAYRQFCQHFLAPLALMSYRDVRLGRLMRVFADGVPLDLASRLLPASSRLRVPLLVHIHLHAKAEIRYADARDHAGKGRRRVSRRGLDGLVDSLHSAISRLSWDPSRTEWSDYYAETSYSEVAARDKESRVRDLLAEIGPRVVWDLGANTGRYSRIAAEKASTLAFDLDPGAVELDYRRVREEGEARLLPIVLDLTNPSPSLGWRNSERPALLERGQPDLVMALALVHHLAIANNLPLSMIADFLADLTPALIIEFVPKEDDQTKRLLATRQDIFTDYDVAGFEREFVRVFEIRERIPLAESLRTLYLMTRR